MKPSEEIIRRVLREELRSETEVEQITRPYVVQASPYKPTLRTAQRCGVPVERVQEVDSMAYQGRMT